LRETPLGAAFFGSVAKAATVKSILQQCYGNTATVTDELVDVILKPGLTAGATKVFLDFISYSGGPLPEELLPKITVPVLIGKSYIISYMIAQSMLNRRIYMSVQVTSYVIVHIQRAQFKYGNLNLSLCALIVSSSHCERNTDMQAVVSSC
jgi:hypothetical protein